MLRHIVDSWKEDERKHTDTFCIRGQLNELQSQSDDIQSTKTGLKRKDFRTEI